jgi:ACR3 family arsenite efflux pump ArsB
MALFGWLFIGALFRTCLPAAAPDTAMVFVRSNLAYCGSHFTRSPVALNDMIAAKNARLA